MQHCTGSGDQLWVATNNSVIKLKNYGQSETHYDHKQADLTHRPLPRRAERQHDQGLRAALAMVCTVLLQWRLTCSNTKNPNQIWTFD